MQLFTQSRTRRLLFLFRAGLVLVCLLPLVAQATNPEFIFGQNYQAINPADLAVTGEDATPTHSATGAFTYDIPLTVPPGRLGMQPDLLLQYNSQALDPDTWFSTGWSLSIPKITRLNKTGYDGFFDKTDFISSLSGELDSVSLSDGQHGTYQTERDSGSFYQYEYNSDGSWTMFDKNGVEYTFGVDTDSRVDNSDDTSQIYAWYLTEKRDPNGNGVIYAYSKDQNQIYLESISYTDHADTAATMSVDFALTDRDDDQLVEYSAGFEVRTYFVVDTITMSVDGTWVREYDFAYAKTDNRERILLESMTETSRAEDGTETALPATTFTYEDTTGGWTLDSLYSIPTTFTSVYSGIPQDNGARLFDANGDGLPDFVYSTDSGGGSYTGPGYVALKNSDSVGWAQDTEYTVPVGFIYTTSTGVMDLGVRIADVNGDGLQDLIKSYGGSDASGFASDGVYLNDPENKTWTLAAGYSIPLEFSYNPGSVASDTGARLVDVNGDRLPDFIGSTDSYNYSGGYDYEGPGYVALNNGDGTGWTTDSEYVIPIPLARTVNSTNAYDLGISFDDVNGDGLTDILQGTFEGDYGVYINQGSEKTWELDSDYGLNWSWLGYNGSTPYDNGVRLFDINGDRLSDMLVAYTGSTGVYEDSYVVEINVGNTGGWTDVMADYPVPVGFIQQSGSGPYVDEGTRFADVDGDGLIDMVKSESVNAGSDNGVYLNDAEPADLLTQIDFGTGANIAIDYEAADHDANPDLPYVVQTVSSLTKDDGLGNSVTTTYDYAGGEHYFESIERQRFAGFSSIAETTADRITTYYYHQGNDAATTAGERADSWYYIGLVYRTETTDAAGTPFATTVTWWDSDDHFTYPSQRTELLYNSDGTHRDTASSFTYDTATGNLTDQTDWGEVMADDDGSYTNTGDDDRTTTYTYATDPSGAIKALPSRVTLNDTDAATVSKTLYKYDDLAFGSVETGNVTQQEVWISGSDYATSSYTYDTYGKRLTQIDPLENATTYTYDDNGLYTETITNALGHVQTFAYDLAVGKPTSLEEANGTITETDYDGLGRPTAERKSSTADAATLETTQSWEYDDTSSPRSVTQRTYLNASTYQAAITYLDGWNRVAELKTLNEDGTGYNEVETTYDELGRRSSVTLPQTATTSEYDAGSIAADLAELYTYDPLNRLTAATNVIGTTSTAYDGLTKTVTDPLGNQKSYEADGLGRLVAVVEYLDGVAHTTSYTWSATDYLTSITDALGNVRNFTYDGRGLQLTAEDLHDVSDTDYGTWIYTYDAAGNRETSLSPNGVMVTYGYDALSRQTSEDASDESGVEVTSTYDSCTGGTGRLCAAAVDGGTTTAYTYDATGNTSSEAITIDGTTYTTSYTYDLQRNVLTTAHPNGTIITNTYNALGLLETTVSSTAVVTDTDYGPHGRVTSQTNGNGMVTISTYDAAQRYRLTRKVTRGSETGTSATTTTTETFYPTAGDGEVVQANASWDTAHDATSGSGATYTSSSFRSGTSKSTSPYYIFRAFLPFDTSSIPDDATITDVNLQVYVSSRFNHDNDGDDFVTVVQTSQASTTALSYGDFDQAGSINNPTEGIDSTERKDITNVSSNAYLSFALNSTGRDWISKTDVTKLGLREGHDVLDSAFTSSSTTSSQYNFLFIRSSEYTGTVYDPMLQVTYSQTTEPEPAEIILQDLSYTYDAAGNITQIVDASDLDTAKTTDYTYDDLYRLESATVSEAADGDNGTITYAYDEIGNLTSRSDLGTYSYDGTDYANPHAVTSIEQTDGTTVTYSYDGNGNLTRDGATGYAWDYKNRLTASGEVTTTTTTERFYPTTGDGNVYKSNASWDTAHDATSGTSALYTGSNMTTGTGKSTSYLYTIFRTFTPFDTSSIPDDAIITAANLHVHVSSKLNNDNDGDDFITVVQTSQASTTALSSADFDQAGSINNPSEGVDTSGRQDITSISTNAYLTFSLNSTGRGWISKTDVTKLGLREGHDVMDSAFTSSSTTATQNNFLYIRTSEYSGTSYDPYLEVTYSQTTEVEGEMSNTVTYAYDHMARRVSKSSDDGTTYYPSDDYSVTDGTSTVYVSGPAGLTASVEYDGTAATTQTIHTDHLGSTSVVTDEDGVMIELLDYHPYGSERISWSSSSTDGSAESEKTYIGEYSDDETNLSYLNARYYDPTIGRFLSQDPWFGDLTNPQSLNKYSYTENNPVKFTDPTGLLRQDTYNSGVDKFNGAVNSALWALGSFSLFGPASPGGWINSIGAAYDFGMGVAETVSATWDAEPVSNEYTFVDFKSEMIHAGIDGGSDFVEFYEQEITESFNQMQEGLAEDWQSITGSESTQNDNGIVEATLSQGDNTPAAQPNYSTNNQYTCPDVSQTASTTTSNWQNSLTNFVKENKK